MNAQAGVLAVMGRAAYLRDAREAVRLLIEAHAKLLASHSDYTKEHSLGWPNGYPDLDWSLEIERQSRAALARVTAP